MGQAPLDLPDPLQAKPLANAGAADDLLSQIASDEIDRLLAEADEAIDEPADDEEAADNGMAQASRGADANESDKPRAEPASALQKSASNSVSSSKASPKIPEVDRRETAVSSFVAQGNPALEAELDGILANLNNTSVASNDSTKAAPTEMKAAVPAEGTATGTASPAAEAVGPATQAPAPSQEQGTREHPADADPVVKGELDQVFDKMTASADPRPTIENSTTAEPAEPAGSIDLLKVLDPIVAKDAARAQEASAAADAAADDEEAGPDEDRLPIYVLVLEWLNAPWGWLPPAVLDAMGKLGILTLINAAAVLLYVLLFRRK